MTSCELSLQRYKQFVLPSMLDVENVKWFSDNYRTLKFPHSYQSCDFWVNVMAMNLLYKRDISKVCAFLFLWWYTIRFICISKLKTVIESPNSSLLCLTYNCLCSACAVQQHHQWWTSSWQDCYYPGNCAHRCQQVRLGWIVVLISVPHWGYVYI